MSKSPLWFRRLLVGGVSTLTVGGLGMTGLLATAGAASATSAFKITQLAGPDRFGTAAAIAAAAFPKGASTVVVASGLDTNLPDSLAASYLAAQQTNTFGGTGAPILLVNTDSVPSATAAAIVSLKPANIIIVGGTSAVTPGVEATLTNGGTITVTRVAGANRFLTADAIDSQTGFEKVGTIDTKASFTKTAIVADGVDTNLVDALGASPLAGAGPYPMFLVNGVTGTLSSTDLSIMATDKITNAIIVGGSSAVGSAVSAQLTAAAITNVTEAGPDRSATSEVLANYEIANYGFLNTAFNIAGGGQPNLVDSLTGGPLGAAEPAPTLITDSPSNAASVVTFAKANAATENSANLFGGSAGVSAATEAAIKAAATSVPTALTTLPTLISANILGTNLVGNNTGATPGTIVQYVFSQNMTNATLTAKDFHVYTAGATAYSDGTAKVDATNADAIDVLYPDTALQTTAGAATLSLATVSSGAVATVSTGTNPDGAEPIGTASTSTLSPGVTTAPDLLAVSAVRPVATGAPNSAVDLTFNKPAYVTTAGVAGFSLVLTDGTPSVCVAPGVGSATASGGTVPGGNGTTTLTLTCANDTSAPTTALTTADIARAIDLAGSVSTTAASGGVTNQAEATVTPNTAVSTNPDLTNVAVNLKVGASGTTDSIVYTFNAPLSAVPTTTTGFNAITAAAGLVTGGSVDTALSTTTKVVIDYTDPALSTVVAGSVTAGTVTSASLAKPNLFNELGVTNPSSTSVTPGIVAAPQLKSVALATYTTAAGTSAQEGTYTFSEPVTVASTLSATTDFHLYDADGTELTCTDPALAASSTTVVNCTTYVQGAALTGTAATATQLSSAVLGTVDAGAVTGTGNPDSTSNPEGAGPA